MDHPTAPAPAQAPVPQRKRRWYLLPCAFVLFSATGCVVAPMERGPYRSSQASVYVAPAYASPGAGWGWQQHPNHGWGWRHPDHGWHQGWR